MVVETTIRDSSCNSTRPESQVQCDTSVHNGREGLGKPGDPLVAGAFCDGLIMKVV